MKQRKREKREEEKSGKGDEEVAEINHHHQMRLRLMRLVLSDVDHRSPPSDLIVS